MKYRNDAGGVVLNAKGQMVLVLQRNGVWSLPKGGMNEGERHIEAARREIGEETGLTNLTLVETLGSYTRYKIDDTGMEDRMSLKRITVCLFTTTQEDVRPHDPRIREAKWVSVDEAIEMLGAPKDQEFLKSIRDKL